MKKESVSIYGRAARTALVLSALAALVLAGCRSGVGGEPQTGEGTGTLVVYNTTPDLSIRITVDGGTRGIVDPNDSIEISVAAGDHTVSGQSTDGAVYWEEADGSPFPFTVSDGGSYSITFSPPAGDGGTDFLNP